LDQNLNIKLIDFGESRVLKKAALQDIDDDDDQITTKNNSTFAGTLPYMAHEVYAKKPYGPKADVYSLALVFWTMFSKKIPFSDMEDHIFTVELFRATSQEAKINGLHDGFQQIIYSGWDNNADKRPSLNQILLILWDMQDKKGRYLCRTYLRLTTQTGLLDLLFYLSFREKEALAITCKHFFHAIPVKNRRQSNWKAPSKDRLSVRA